MSALRLSADDAEADLPLLQIPIALHGHESEYEEDADRDIDRDRDRHRDNGGPAATTPLSLGLELRHLPSIRRTLRTPRREASGRYQKHHSNPKAARAAPYHQMPWMRFSSPAQYSSRSTCLAILPVASRGKSVRSSTAFGTL